MNKQKQHKQQKSPQKKLQNQQKNKTATNNRIDENSCIEPGMSAGFDERGVKNESPPEK